MRQPPCGLQCGRRRTSHAHASNPGVGRRVGTPHTGGIRGCICCTCSQFEKISACDVDEKCFVCSNDSDLGTEANQLDQ